MNWGLALLSLVILYAVTRDRWRWRRIVLGAVGLLVAGVAGFALLLWGMDRKDERERLEARVARAERLRIVVGGDKNDALLRLGQPDSVSRGSVSASTIFGYAQVRELESAYLEQAGADAATVHDSIAASFEPERWHYLDESGGSWQEITFRGDTVTSVVFWAGNSWNHRNEWTPEDGVSLGTQIAVGEASLDGSCDVRTYDESQVHVLPHDGVASRVVDVQHRSRRVRMHGWVYQGCPTPGSAGGAEP